VTWQGVEVTECLSTVSLSGLHSCSSNVADSNCYKHTRVTELYFAHLRTSAFLFCAASLSSFPTVIFMLNVESNCFRLAWDRSRELWLVCPCNRPATETAGDVADEYKRTWNIIMSLEYTAHNLAMWVFVTCVNSCHLQNVVKELQTLFVTTIRNTYSKLT
jgi:hypothetical protein